MKQEILLPKIYILTNTLYQGGAEKQSVILAKALKNNYVTTLIVYYGNNYDERLLKEIVQNDIKPLFLKGNHISKLWYLYKMFKKNKNAVVFSYLATANTINAIIGSISKIKYKVGGVRNAHLSFSKFLLQRFLHNHFLTATVFNNYEGQIKLTSRGFNKSKSFVIHNGIEIRENEIKKTRNDNSVEILTVGRFVPQKDYYTALQVIYKLKQKLSSFSVKFVFTIVGYGEQEDIIRQWVNKFELNDDVNIVINPNDIRNYFKKADIYLSTSLFEGLSNSIMEAMEFSLPIVATDVGDNKYLILDGITGYLAPVKSTSVIVDRLERLINSIDLRFEMGKKSYNHLKNNFSNDIFYIKYNDFIHELTK